jgi:hypothetical protein
VKGWVGVEVGLGVGVGVAVGVAGQLSTAPGIACVSVPLSSSMMAPQWGEQASASSGSRIFRSAHLAVGIEVSATMIN